ncbi:DUF2285 domain-containing protein [Ruegeria sp.]|uniref:DUF2285 domain-containing protein n=1 Tax=Ruegeria sp. TaxID=1879320 RepID=UPI003AFF8302
MQEKESEPGISPCADWRNPDHYRPLLAGDRHRWAGEWLRRNPAFVADLTGLCCCPFDTSSHVICDMDCPLAPWGVRCCRVVGGGLFFWLASCNPQVLQLEAGPLIDPLAATVPDNPDALCCGRLPLLRGVVRGGDGQHLLFSDGARHLQLMVTGGDALAGPVLPGCTLRGLTEFGNKPLSVSRLYGLAHRGRLLRRLWVPERRAPRWVLMLRALDGAASGASQCEIAGILFGSRAAGQDWDAGYRTRVQRLLAGARTMVRGGYRQLLDPQGKPVPE